MIRFKRNIVALWFTSISLGSIICGLSLASFLPSDHLKKISEPFFSESEIGIEPNVILRSLAKDCASATEIGVKSLELTLGVLQGLSESSKRNLKYLGIDSQYPHVELLDLAKSKAAEKDIDFTFWRANDLQIEIEPTDLLVLNCLQTYCHLLYDLDNFAHRAKKYIFIPNAGGALALKDDREYRGDYKEYPASYDKTQRGVWTALADFLFVHSEWRVQPSKSNNYEFIILERKENYIVKDPVYHPEVNEYLKHKMVLCTGPANGRRDLLLKATESDMALMPFKKIFLVTNDAKNMDLVFNGQVPSKQLIQVEGKQLDCLNTIIFCLQSAVNDPEIKDDDIILFKHESVYINDLSLIKKAISKILEGYDMVVRLNECPWYQGARGSDVFFVRKAAVKEFINSIPKICALRHVGDCCEKYYTDHIVNAVKKVYNVPYAHSNGGFTELGFYHIYSPYTCNDPAWDRKNRDQLFNEQQPQ